MKKAPVFDQPLTVIDLSPHAVNRSLEAHRGKMSTVNRNGPDLTGVLYILGHLYLYGTCVGLQYLSKLPRRTKFVQVSRAQKRY